MSLPAFAAGMARDIPFTVAEVNIMVAAAIAAAPPLLDCRVEGEVSQVTRASSGHLYFTLKDDLACISCVMWRSHAARLRFAPRSGDQVIARGSVEVYAPRGQFQLVARDLAPAGEGALFAALARAKARLEAEGLLDPSRKRPIPAAPRRVALVTSPAGAALRDILITIRRLRLSPELVLCPAQVQGAGSEESLIRALGRAASLSGVEVILLARGGGSVEDLWSFNSEAVARAIAACPVPVISGVGHENDLTLADMAADLRAATPTAAAELLCRSRMELEERMQRAVERALRELTAQAGLARLRLQAVTRRPVLLDPVKLLMRPAQQLDELAGRADAAAGARCADARGRLELAAGRAASASPLALMGRGYAYVTKLPQGEPLRSIEGLLPGDRLKVRLPDGEAGAAVTDVRRAEIS